jgi:hypothetical protein
MAVSWAAEWAGRIPHDPPQGSSPPRRRAQRIWKRKYRRRPFVESTYHAENAAVGEVLPSMTWEMKDRYHLLKTLSYELMVYARRERERETFYVR